MKRHSGHGGALGPRGQTKPGARLTATGRGVWVASLCALGLLGAAGEASADWYKGNTHCHTSLSSDSSTPIEALMAWYKAHDYDFVVVTDHNRYSTQASLNALEAFDESLGRRALLADDTFSIIPGEELTTSAHHINGLDLPMRVAPASTIAAAFELVWAHGALPQLNHPEWNYLRARNIIEELSELDGPMFLEIYNSHPSVVERSGPSSEDIWDSVLSAGQRMWGVAVDDAHTLEGGDKPPGGGFVYVEASSPAKEDIIAALAAGRFYASTGATLDSFDHTANFYEVDAPGATEIVFIGREGAILERIEGDFASYRFQGNEQYVRARITSPQGHAWTQPVYLDTLPDNTPPEARISASSTTGEAPLTIEFDGTASSDPDDDIVTWRWDFGDGTTGRGEAILHTYEEPGSYTVELTVFDAQGELGRDTLLITALAPGQDPPANNGDGPPDEDGEDTGEGDPQGESDAGLGGDVQGDEGVPTGAIGQARDDGGCAVGAGSSGGPRPLGWISMWLIAVIAWRRARPQG